MGLPIRDRRLHLAAGLRRPPVNGSRIAGPAPPSVATTLGGGGGGGGGGYAVPHTSGGAAGDAWQGEQADESGACRGAAPNPEIRVGV